MSQVPTVAFVFTRPDAIVLFGRNWTNKKEKRYRFHIYPSPTSPDSGPEFELDKARPNVVVLTRLDKRFDLEPYAKKLHRVIAVSTANNAQSLGIPIADAVDEGDGYKPAPRNTIEWYRHVVEELSEPLDLVPPKPAAVELEKTTNKQKGKSKKDTKRPASKTPKVWSLVEYLQEIERTLEDEDTFSQLDAPTLKYILGEITQTQFQRACKELSNFGVPKKLAKSFYRWLTGDGGTPIIGAFYELLDKIEEGGPVNIDKIAKMNKVKPEDLSLLLTILKEDSSIESSNDDSDQLIE